jgi:hypothetical protein
LDGKLFFVFVPISILSIILINKKINIPDEKILINENTESIDTLTNKKLSKLNLIDFKGTITLALLDIIFFNSIIKFKRI